MIEKVEREAALFDLQKALDEKALRIELQQKLLDRKESTLVRSSMELETLRKSIQCELSLTMEARPADPPGEGAAQSQSLQEELRAAKAEILALEVELKHLRRGRAHVENIGQLLSPSEPKELSSPRQRVLALLKARAQVKDLPSDKRDEEVVQVKRDDLEDLWNDNRQLEHLMEAYQKENEKLVALMAELRQKAAHDKAELAAEQEALNKELNALRNRLLDAGQVPNMGNARQADLKAEAQLRYLEDEFAKERQVGSSIRLRARVRAEVLSLWVTSRQRNNGSWSFDMKSTNSAKGSWRPS
jgi:hypothetical protein